MSAQWVPDELAKACSSCRETFGFFFRRHHCRLCGDVFCDGCSSHRVKIRPGDDPVRACNACFEKTRVRKENSKDTKLAQGARILYETRSICFRCGFLESNGFKFGHNVSYVLQVGGEIFLYSQCGHPSHIRQPTVTKLCSDARLFHRVLSFAVDPKWGPSVLNQLMHFPHRGPLLDTMGNDMYTARSQLQIPLPGAPTAQPQLQQQPGGQRGAPAVPPGSAASASPAAGALTLDSKELYRRLITPSRCPSALPLVVELDLCHDGAVVSPEVVRAGLRKLGNLYPPGVTFLLKLNVGLVALEDIKSVNDRILLVDRIMNGASLAAEADAAAGAGAGAGAGAAGASSPSAGMSPRGAPSSLLGQASPTRGSHLDASAAEADADAAAAADADADADAATAAAAGVGAGRGAAARCFILVDASFERVIDICRLDDSAFVRGRVFPLVRYFLVPGEEQQCFDEVALATRTLQSFVDIQLALLIAVDDDALPNLTRVSALALALKRTVRFVLFSRERSFSALKDRTLVRARAAQSADPSGGLPVGGAGGLAGALSSLVISDSSRATPAMAIKQTEAHLRSVTAAAAAAASAPNSPAAGHASGPLGAATAAAAAAALRVESTDPMPLLRALHSATGGLLSPDSFIPLAAGSVLSPVLDAMGLGELPLSPDPFSALVAVVIHRSALPPKAAAKVPVHFAHGPAASASVTLSPAVAAQVGSLAALAGHTSSSSSSAASNMDQFGRRGSKSGGGSRRGSAAGTTPPGQGPVLSQGGADHLPSGAGVGQEPGQPSWGANDPAKGFVSLYHSTVTAMNAAAMFDLKKLYDEMVPIAAKLEGGGSLGVLSGAKVMSVLSKAKLQSAPIAVDDLISVTASAEEQKRRFRNCQVFIVLNEMDFGSVDLLRRMRPLVVRQNPDDSSHQEFVASSIGGI